MWVYVFALSVALIGLAIGGCYALFLWALYEPGESSGRGDPEGPVGLFSQQAVLAMLRRWLGSKPLLLSYRRDARGRFRRMR